MITATNFFPAIFINILILIAYVFGAFIILNWLINGSLINLKAKNKILKEALIAFLGLIFGSFAFVYISWDGYGIFIFLFIPTIFILAHKFGRSISYGIIIPIAISIGITFMETKNINFLILNYTLASLCFISAIVSSFLKWRISYVFLFMLLLNYTLVFVISGILYSRTIGNYHPAIVGTEINFLYYAMIILFSFLGSLILFTILRYYSRFMVNSRNIQVQTKYKNGFIISENIVNDINEFIVQNNVSKALILLVSFRGIDELLTYKSASHVHDVISKILLQMKEKLSVHYNFLPYVENNQYFLFIDISYLEKININLSKSNNSSRRNKNDFLYEFEKLFRSLIRVEILDNKKYKIEPSLQALIYGIQSNNLKDINSFLLSSLFNISNKNNLINLLDADSFYNKYSTYNKSRLLENINLFSTNEIEVSIKLEKTKNGRNYYKGNAMILTKILLDKKDFYKISDSEYINDVIMCHISALLIKEFVNKKLNKSNNYLIIDYPYNIIASNELDIQGLINSISSYNLQTNKIILNIFTDPKRIDNKQFNKNLNLLLKNNIKYHLDYTSMN